MADSTQEPGLTQEIASSTSQAAHAVKHRAESLAEITAENAKIAAETVATAAAEAVKLAIASTAEAAEAVRIAVTETAAKAIQAAELMKIAVADTVSKATIADEAVKRAAATTAAISASASNKAIHAAEAVKRAVTDIAENSAEAVKVATHASATAEAVKSATHASANAEIAILNSQASANAEIAILNSQASANAEIARPLSHVSVAAEVFKIAPNAAETDNFINPDATNSRAVEPINLASISSATSKAVMHPMTNVVTAESIRAASTLVEIGEAVKSANAVAETADAVKVATEAVASSSTEALKVASEVVVAVAAAAEAASAAALAANKAADALKLAIWTISENSAEAVKEVAAVAATEAAKAVDVAAFRSACTAAEAAAAIKAAALIAAEATAVAVKIAAEAIKTAAEATAETVKIAADAAAAAIEEKATAELASQFKTQFIAHMSHEIRTPLAIIRGYTEILALEELSPQKKIWFNKILQSTKQLELLINDILDISKVEAGKVELDLQSVALPQIITDLKDLLSLKVAEKGIYLDFVLESSVPSKIYTDPLRLKQILLNVIGNAIKFTDQGGVTVKIKLIPPHDNTTTYCLAFAITDTGIGMTAEQSEKIFASFTQADSSITRKFGGTGLGLSISMGLAHLLGGDIVVSNSIVGQGSTFNITINPGPVKEVDMLKGSNALEMPSVHAIEEVPTVACLSGMKILLVEDAEDVRALIDHILVRQGASVTQAKNGEEGVQLARRASFDLIIMDIQMPVLDGYRATQRLRSEGYLMPIFALTAHAMAGEEKNCISAGFTDYLSKPIDFNKLFKMAAKYQQSPERSAISEAVYGGMS